MREESLLQISSYLEKNFDEYLNKLKRWIRIESTSATGKGIQDNVDYVYNLFNELGGETEVVSIKDGNPVVYSKILSNNPQAKTVFWYNHYDTVPANEVDWVIQPFEARIMDSEDIPGIPELGRVLVGRGTADAKTPIIADVQGIKAMLEVTGDIPVNLHLICEGEEEIGSPHLWKFAKKKKGELKKADCFIIFYCNRGLGLDMQRVTVRLGCKGSIWCELLVKGGKWGGPIQKDLETDTTWIDAPPWRLLWALTSLHDSSGKILIDGFYDDMRPPTPQEKELVLKAREQIFDEEKWKKHLGIEKFRRGLPGKDLFLDWILSPEIGIVGFQSGYMGPRTKPCFPREASAKLLILLQPNQDPKDILWKLRKHLNTHGFPEVEIHVDSYFSAVRSSPESYLTRSMVNAVRRHSLKPVIWPTLWSYGPYSCLIDKEVEFGGAGLCGGGYYHRSNEYAVVDTILEGMQFMATWCYEYAGLLPPFKPPA